jgi:DNA invertase Pin-like site-specific DNA recombinase
MIALAVTGVDASAVTIPVASAAVHTLNDRDAAHASTLLHVNQRMVAGVLASLAELELGLGKERRTASREARRARGQSIGRPKALDASKVALAQRMHAGGESASTIGEALGISRATVYRALAG